MPGTRTAPTVGALTPTSSSATLHLVDASGDTTAEGLSVVGAGLLDYAEVEAIAAAYQSATNTSLWKVSQHIEWEGQLDPQNALALFRANIESGINLLFKNPVLQDGETPRVVAPIATIMQGNQDIPLLVAPLDTLVTAYLAVLGANWSLDSMQYTGRRERANNPRIRT